MEVASATLESWMTDASRRRMDALSGPRFSSSRPIVVWSAVRAVRRADADVRAYVRSASVEDESCRMLMREGASARLVVKAMRDGAMIKVNAGCLWCGFRPWGAMEGSFAGVDATRLWGEHGWSLRSAEQESKRDLE